MSVLCNFVLAVQVALFATVSSMEVYTIKQLHIKNGTDARLKCTFSSSAPLGDGVSVSWIFRPLSGGGDESVFYYHKEPFPPTQGRFQNRAVWDGNVERGDGSVILKFVQPTDNGTYLCQVKNPPDVHGEMGETELKVVNEGK
ncbi:myelin protein zero-like protein 2 [Leptodactylus fuscus]